MNRLRYYEAPNYYTPIDGDPAAVFLAGGITGCPRWHDHAVKVLAAAGVPMVVLNPNRRNFPIHDPDAGEEQVRWEQHHLLLPATITMMWFPAPIEPHIVQPIAMFEFGQAINSRPDRLLVGADPGYPRERDVRLMMRVHHSGTPVHATLDALLAATVKEVRRRGPVTSTTSS